MVYCKLGGDKRRMTVLYEAKNVVGGSLPKCEQKGSVVKTRDLVERK